MRGPAIPLIAIALIGLAYLWAGFRRARIVEPEPFSSPDDWGDR